MLAWPAALKPNGGGFAQTMRSLSGGPALSGFEQVVPQMIDRWQARYQIPMRSRGDVLMMRGLLSNLRGRAGTVALPAYENRYAPWHTDQYGRRFTPKFVRHRSLDGSPYADPANINDTLITASVAGAVPAQATSLTIRITKGDPLQSGNRFSINARLYEIQAVTAVYGNDYNVNIWPWLRFAAYAGTVVDFTTPVCEMRLVSDDQGQDAMLSLDQMKFATPILQFEEAAPLADDPPP